MTIASSSIQRLRKTNTPAMIRASSASSSIRLLFMATACDDGLGCVYQIRNSPDYTFCGAAWWIVDNENGTEFVDSDESVYMLRKRTQAELRNMPEYQTWAKQQKDDPAAYVTPDSLKPIDAIYHNLLPQEQLL
jgi:hypothetical protein